MNRENAISALVGAILAVIFCLLVFGHAWGAGANLIFWSGVALGVFIHRDDDR